MNTIYDFHINENFHGKHRHRLEANTKIYLWIQDKV